MARGDKGSKGSAPQLDVYSALLFVSFAALFTSCIVLFLQIKWQYGGF